MCLSALDLFLTKWSAAQTEVRWPAQPFEDVPRLPWKSLWLVWLHVQIKCSAEWWNVVRWVLIQLTEAQTAPITLCIHPAEINSKCQFHWSHKSLSHYRPTVFDRSGGGFGSWAVASFSIVSSLHNFCRGSFHRTLFRNSGFFLCVVVSHDLRLWGLPEVCISCGESSWGSEGHEPFSWLLTRTQICLNPGEHSSLSFLAI